MIKLYNESGEFCLCNPDQVESMKSIGYTLDKSPIPVQEKIDTIVEQVVEQVAEEKPKKSKKDIIL